LATRALVRWARRALLAAVPALVFAGVTFGATASSQAATQGPCDIYAAAGTPCVAAHSTTRALYATYDGPLYQVQRASDDTYLNVDVLTAGGIADAAAQDAFCAETTCIITEIYDQSGHGNNLAIEGAGGHGRADVGAGADVLPVTLDGQKVYGLYIEPGMGYRDDDTTDVPTGADPQGVYMVTSGAHVNSSCCFDYGNAETDNDANGDGHMDAVNFGTECWFTCDGSGPWVQADLESGLYQSDTGGSQNAADTGSTSPFVTALLKDNGTSQFALKAGNAQSGALTTEYAGALPSGYDPMHQEGAILLGTGGDDSNGSIGSFFEGVVTSGYPTDAADNAVQADIVAAGYGTYSRPAPFTAGTEMSINATTACCTSDYIQHDSTDDKVVIAPVSSSSSATAKADSDWIVEPGLEDSSCISFESANESGEYLRHLDYELYLEPNDGSVQFAQDATFCPEEGHTGEGYSFESVNFPNDYIRHFDYTVYLAGDGGSLTWDSTNLWPNDTTFLVASPR
jgi:non-reducing end alpha-L-arabinofuranosidase